MRHVVSGVTAVASLLGIWISAALPVAAIAQKAVVMIDGRKEPEKIPEWILWRETLLIIEYLGRESPTKGIDVWIAKVGVNPDQMNKLITQATAFRSTDLARKQQASERMDKARHLPPDQYKELLRQLDAEEQANVLAHRDSLRNAIGSDAFSKLNLFARKEIATGIQVGEIVESTLAPGKTPR